MNAQNPDPNDSAGLEEGGGVAPGDTPPAETSAGGPNHEPPQRSRLMPILVICFVALLAIVIAGGLIGRVAGLFG